MSLKDITSYGVIEKLFTTTKILIKYMILFYVNIVELTHSGKTPLAIFLVYS